MKCYDVAARKFWLHREELPIRSSVFYIFIKSIYFLSDAVTLKSISEVSLYASLCPALPAVKHISYQSVPKNEGRQKVLFYQKRLF